MKINGSSSGISLHYEKHKGNDTAVNGLQRHNERKPGQKHSNKNIKDDRTAENVFLRKSPKKYKAEIEDKITQNKKGGMKGVRKNSVRMVEATVQLSGKILEQPEEKQEEVLRDMYEWLKEEHGEDNIISAVIHKDETNMHLHFDFVPITEDKRLSARDIISQSNLKRMQRESLEYVQEMHPSMLFERGNGETKGLSQKDFEAFKKLQEESEAVLDEYSEALDEHDDELSERETALNEKTQKVLKTHENVQQRARKVEIRENALKEREDVYTAKFSALQDKEGAVAERESNVSENAKRLKEQQEAVKRQKMAVEAKEREVEEKDQGADEKLSEAQNKLDTATEKDEQASKKLEEAEKLNEDAIFKLAETEKRLAEIQRENKESKEILKELKRFGNRFMAMIEAVRNGEIGKRTAARVASNLEEPYDTKENLELNNSMFDDLEDTNQLSL